MGPSFGQRTIPATQALPAHRVYRTLWPRVQLRPQSELDDRPGDDREERRRVLMPATRGQTFVETACPAPSCNGMAERYDSMRAPGAKGAIGQRLRCPEYGRMTS
jgi:hypothetical protein